ncbi:hypothetical protein AALA24_09900 [Anaerovoracaceae bacterium 42-11]
MIFQFKKIISLLLCLLLSLTLFSCGKKQTTISKDGQMLFLDKAAIENDNREGFFVLNEDKTFTPVMNAADGYAGETTDEDNIYERYLWFTNNDITISELIPTVSKKTPLVAIYQSDDDMPSIYTLERYIYKGYTLGCHIYRDEDDSLYLDTTETLQGSSAEKGIAEFDEQKSYVISKINNSDVLPIKNVDNNMRILLGLEKNKYYDFDFYKGTRYETLTVSADTLIMQAQDIIVLQNPYTRTTDGYFLINLPDNLEAGYYYVCGVGLFRYLD